jgi:hypothetical protein
MLTNRKVMKQIFPELFPGQSGVPTVSLTNPFPNIQTQVVGNSNGLSQNIGTSLSIIDQNRHAPIYESYSCDCEDRVCWRPRPYCSEQFQHQSASGQTVLSGTALTTQVANKYGGHGSFGAGTVNKYQTLLPFPQYQAADAVEMLQLKEERRGEKWRLGVF